MIKRGVDGTDEVLSKSTLVSSLSGVGSFESLDGISHTFLYLSKLVRIRLRMRLLIFDLIEVLTKSNFYLKTVLMK